MSFALYTLSFDPKKPGNNNQLYKAAYDMWLKVWRESYSYFGWDPDSIRSDQWMRQDRIFVLFDGSNPVCLAFYDVKNMNYDMYRHDSYFRMWPQDLLDQVSKMKGSHEALISSYFTLSPDYRSKKHDIDFKLLFHALGLKYFTTFKSEFMIGTMVKKSGMADISFKHGANLLAKDVDEKGVLVDLLYWENEKMKDFKFPFNNDLVEQVWSQHNVLPLRKAA